MDILLIEDNPADIQLFQEALKDLPLPCHVSVLMHPSELEAFVAQARTATLASPPQPPHNGICPKTKYAPALFCCDRGDGPPMGVQSELGAEIRRTGVERRHADLP